MGSFRPVAGNLHLHRYYNFTESFVETVPKSLHLSCGSELTRQGISLPSDRYSYGRRLLGLRFSASGRTLTHPLTLPAPGRCQPLYFAFLASPSPVLLINSPLGLLTSADSKSKHPFSLSCGVIVPSSLTRVLPLTFGYSPCLPVSVSGTGTRDLTRGFSWQCGIRNFVNNSLPITA